MSALLYLYGVTRGKPLLPAEGVVPQAPPYALSEGALVAIVSQVPLGEFSDAQLAACEWLTARARIHDQVLVAVLRQAPVVPAAVACLFSGEPEIRRYLTEHAERFDALLEHFEGKEEWLVKLLYQRKESIALPDLLTAVRLAEPGPGLRAAQTFENPRHGNEAEQQVMTICQDICQLLRSVAHGFAVRQLAFQTPGEDPVLVLGNWAFLVDRRFRERFHECLSQAGRQYGDRGFRLQSTGPWAPFSFAIAPPPDLGFSIDELVARRPLVSEPVPAVAKRPPTLAGRLSSPQKRSS